LNEKRATPTTAFYCEQGKYRYGSRVLHDVHAYGDLTLAEVITKSSNIGTVKMAALLEPDIFQRYIELFGFGRSTGIDLPGESAGFTRPISQWSKTSPYNVPIGQEILVTAVQLASAMAVIANGGDLVTPYVIESVRDEAGITERMVEALANASPEVAEAVRNILVAAVESGTGKAARIEGIQVGGKTGTAQKILENAKGYSHSNFMASFAGFAPADRPKYVMVVVVDDPQPLYYGGTVAAPVFKEVMESILFTMGYIPKNFIPAPASQEKSSPSPTVCLAEEPERSALNQRNERNKRK
jgi:cell division protein FtsI (penicillin-binding protein 3)